MLCIIIENYKFVSLWHFEGQDNKLLWKQSASCHTASTLLIKGCKMCHFLPRKINHQTGFISINCKPLGLINREQRHSISGKLYVFRWCIKVEFKMSKSAFCMLFNPNPFSWSLNYDTWMLNLCSWPGFSLILETGVGIGLR